MIDADSIADIVGPVAVTEFNNAADHYKPRLIVWARELPTLTDEQFLSECTRAIYDSALVGRFRGNWEHEHFKATACYYDAKRRHTGAGHSSDCRGGTLYSQGHAAAMRSAGHAPLTVAACTCGTEEESDGRG